MDPTQQLDNIALFKYLLSPSHLKSTQRLVLLGIFKHRNNKTFLCFPSVEKISECTSLNKRTVRRTIEELVKNGDLLRVRNSSGNRVFGTFYFSPHDFENAVAISENEESTFFHAGEYDLLEKAKAINDSLIPF